MVLVVLVVGTFNELVLPLLSLPNRERPFMPSSPSLSLSTSLWPGISSSSSSSSSSRSGETDVVVDVGIEDSAAAAAAAACPAGDAPDPEFGGRRKGMKKIPIGN